MNTIIWLVLMVIFLIAEASTVSVVSIWFAAGSLAGLVVSLLGGGLGLQIGTCVVVSGLLLACLRPVVRKYFTPRITRTNVDSVVGMEGYVTGDIDNIAATGSVKLGGMEWTARSATGQPIPRGALVRVEKIEGVKAFVTPVETLAEV